MSKNKKAKVVKLHPAPLSPEKYIKTQARSLPVAECFITEDWENAGICNIMISRKHRTGNITTGFYLVDLYCLGLKDTFYEFNLDQDQYNDIRNYYAGSKECDYTLAHNIIYGAIAFAEDFGFKPHKLFEVSRFILEEDDDHVPLIDIDFGMDGEPYFVRGPHDDAAKVQGIIKTLERTAGEGNFTIVDLGDDFDGDFDDDEDWDDEDWDDDEDMDDADLFEAMQEDFAPFLKAAKKINSVYEKNIRSPETKEALKKNAVGKKYKLNEDEVKDEYTVFDNAAQENDYNRHKDMVINDFDKAVKGLKKCISKYPDKPGFYNLLQSAYVYNGQYEKADEICAEIYKHFPQQLFAKINYANLLINNEDADMVAEVFSGTPDLNDFYPDRKTFHKYEAASFYAVMCRYFTAIDDLDSADLYMNALYKNKLIDLYGPTILRLPIVELAKAKILAMTGADDL